MREKILIVDDEKIIRMYLRMILTDQGYDVIEAEDGREALLKLAAEGHVDIVVTDLRMPDIGGIELINLMQEMEEYQNIPIIVISSILSESTRREVAQAPVMAWIEKPFRPGTLVKAISEAMGRRQTELSWISA